MKRGWISLVILICLVGAGVIGNRYTNTVCSGVMQTVSEAKDAEMRGETDAAVRLSQKAISDWQDGHRALSTFMQHNRLEAVGQMLAGLPALSKYGEKDQFLADCDRSIEQLSELSETEAPDAANIF